MNQIRKALLGCLLAVGGTSANTAEAAYCWTANATNCNQVSYSGPNYSMATVGPGVVCATFSPQETNYNKVVHCYKPVGSTGQTMVDPPTDPQGYFPGSEGGRFMQSVTMQGPGNGGLGPVTLFALSSDGYVFESQANTQFLYTADKFTPWVAVIEPMTEAGTVISLRQIASIQPAYGGATLHALSKDNKLYTRVGTRWRHVNTAARYRLLFSGPLGAIVQNGTVASGTSLSGLYRTNNTLAPYLPNHPYSPRLKYYGSEFQAMGQTQPLAMGVLDAWMLTESNTPGGLITSLYRSMYANGTWGAWTSVDLSRYDWGGSSRPWSVIDGEQYRGLRGTVFVIARTYHMNELLPR